MQISRAEYLKEYQKKYRGKNKAYRVNLTLSKYEYNGITQLANDNGLSRAEYIKSQAFSGIRKSISIPGSIIKELNLLKLEVRAIGNNVNQIAKYSNEVKYLITNKNLLIELGKLEKLLFTFINKKLKKENDY